MVDILMATYNGEKYINEQIDSILKQTFQDFRVLIRDDGSSDDTLSIIMDYVEKYPNKIELITDNVKCGSSTSNFMQLLNYASSEYVMFCDQDDYWIETKVEKMVNKIKEVEKTESDGVLVFSSYFTVDEKLENRQKSNIKIDKNSFKTPRMLVENCINGCCMIMNKKIYKSNLGCYDSSIMMHDWWLGIYASVFGKIVYFNEQLMLYRQHFGQAVGANESSKLAYLKSRSDKKKYSNIIKRYVCQAKHFYDIFAFRMDDATKKLFEEFINIYSCSKLRRIRVLRKNKILKKTFLARIGQYYYV